MYSDAKLMNNTRMHNMKNQKKIKFFNSVKRFSPNTYDFMLLR